MEEAVDLSSDRLRTELMNTCIDLHSDLLSVMFGLTHCMYLIEKEHVLKSRQCVASLQIMNLALGVKMTSNTTVEVSWLRVKYARKL